jgi:hypothetical protein
MTYADEAGSPPSTGDGDGQGDLHKGNGGTADAEMVDADVAAARVSGADVRRRQGVRRRCGRRGG